MIRRLEARLALLADLTSLLISAENDIFQRPTEGRTIEDLARRWRIEGPPPNVAADSQDTTEIRRF